MTDRIPEFDEKSADNKKPNPLLDEFTADIGLRLDFKKPSSMKKYFSFKNPPATANMQAARDIVPKSGGEYRLVC